MLELAASYSARMIYYLMVLVGLGILWWPFGCLICGLIARRRGLSVSLWTKRSFISSGLLLLPWFYTFASVRGVRVPRLLTRMAYIVLYSAWLCGPIAFMLLPFMEILLHLTLRSSDTEYGEVIGIAQRNPFFFMFWASLTIANLCTWFVSLRALLRKQRDGAADFDGAYFWPWLLTIVWCLVAGVIFLLSLAVWADEYGVV